LDGQEIPGSPLGQRRLGASDGVGTVAVRSSHNVFQSECHQWRITAGGTGSGPGGASLAEFGIDSSLGRRGSGSSSWLSFLEDRTDGIVHRLMK